VRRELKVVPASRRVSGHIRDLQKDSLGHMMRSHLNHGHVLGMRLGPRWLYSFSHPEDVEEILKTSWKLYSKRTRVYELLVPLLGTGLFTSDGQVWVAKRKRAHGAFRPGMLEQYSKVMEEEADMLACSLKEGSVVELEALAARTALQIVARNTLGMSLSPDEVRRIREGLAGSIEGITERLHSVLSPPLWVPTRTNRRLKKALESLHGAVDDIMRRGNPASGGLASVLVESGVTGDELRDELITFIFAGHESTATALMWTLLLLSRHPEVEGALVEEITGAREDVGDMPFLDGVVREALRLFPPQWGQGRNADEDGVVGDVVVPKGTIVGIHSWVTHRHPDFWEEAEAFRPMRWEGMSAERRKAWFPFGKGPRQCIGQAFAMMELKILLAKVLPRVRLEIEDTVPTAGIVLRPAGVMRARVTARA